LAAWVWIAVALAVVGCGDNGGPSAGSGTAPAVEALPARSGSLPLEEVLSGVVRARNQVAIRPELSAPVVEVLVRNGDRVVVGQPLVRLDDDTPREQLRQSEASLRLAEATASEARARVAEIEAQVKRTRSLAREALVSELELETREAQLLAAEAQAAQAEARVEQGRATVDERRAAMARTVVRAPVGGRVGQRDVEVGMMVDPGSTLFLLGDFDDLIVEVPLTQGMLRYVSEDTPVEVEARDLEGDLVRASISRISPFLEQTSFSTIAEIDVPGTGGGLRPGMFVTVSVLYGASQRATLVPSSAVWENPRTGDPTVFVVEESTGLSEPAAPEVEIPDQLRRVTMRSVEVLAEGRGQIGLRGVGPGEWVVTLGQHLLHRAIQADGGDATAARVRPTSWDRVLGLQRLQREDLLERFLAKQRAVARELGAELPPSPELVDEALAASRASAAGNVPGEGPSQPRPEGG
jgi:RND family efflux transporter MFP subunit